MGKLANRMARNIEQGMHERALAGAARGRESGALADVARKNIESRHTVKGALAGYGAQFASRAKGDNKKGRKK